MFDSKADCEIDLDGLDEVQSNPNLVAAAVGGRPEHAAGPAADTDPGVALVVHSEYDRHDDDGEYLDVGVDDGEEGEHPNVNPDLGRVNEDLVGTAPPGAGDGAAAMALASTVVDLDETDLDGLVAASAYDDSEYLDVGAEPGDTNLCDLAAGGAGANAFDADEVEPPGPGPVAVASEYLAVDPGAVNDVEYVYSQRAASSSDSEQSDDSYAEYASQFGGVLQALADHSSPSVTNDAASPGQNFADC